MPINPQHLASVTFKDTSKELSSQTIHVGPITALTIAGFLSAFGTYKTATQGLSLGALVQDQWVGDKTKYSAATPTDDNAHRERKWRVTYQDTVNLSLHDTEIPIAATTGATQSLLINDSDQADFTADEWVAWIAAFEALAKSPDGNAVNVLEAELVGRNL